MNNDKKIFLKRNITKLIFDAILIILGLIFIIFPNIFVSSVGIIAGTIFLLIGVGGILISLFSSGFLFSSIFSIIIFTIFIVFGLIFIFNPSSLVSILPILLIVYLLISGINKIFSFIRFKYNKAFILNFILGIIFVISAITLMFFIDEFNNFIGILVGIILLLIGISSLIDIISKFINNKKDNFNKEQKIIDFKGKENAIDADIVDIKDSDE